MEFYCLKDNKNFGAVLSKCPSDTICYNGACTGFSKVPNPTPQKYYTTEKSCQQGNNFQKQTTIFNNNNYDDFCVAGPSLWILVSRSSIVFHFYCNKNGSVGTKTMYCPNDHHCFYGKCVKGKE